MFEQAEFHLTFERGFGHSGILVVMILSIMITILISRLKTRLILLPLIGILTLAACGNGATATDDDLHIVATTSIWGDVVAEIVGEDATVEVLIPRGADVHEYQASPQQVASLTEADLVVANGLGLEEGLHDVLETAAEDGANLLELAPDLDPLPFAAHSSEEHEDEEHEEEEHEEESHDHGDLDPHVWFDPARVAQAAQLIAIALSEVDDATDWAERAEAYSTELAQVEAEMEQIFDSIPTENRKLVTNHDAFGYLADRFGFEVVGVVIPGGSSLGDPSSAELAALVTTIEEEGVRAIFAETSHSADLAEAVADEIGSEVVVIELHTGSLGEVGSEAGTLAGMLLVDAQLIADGLS